jgi:hypothetical protein
MRSLDRRTLLFMELIAAGCVFSFFSSARSAPRDEIEEAKKIAIDEVLKREKWTKMRADVGAGWRGKSGTVTVWRLPERPGSHRVVEIRDGKVVKYELGR